MKKDPIIIEELWRSVAVYFISFLLVGIVNHEGYISIGGLETFILAFILTAVHFALMVSYRKKEQLINPSILSIIDHVLQPKKAESRNGIHPESGQNLRFILAMLVFAYVIYRYLV